MTTRDKTLRDWGMEYIDRGWSLIPIGMNKRLNWEFIPRDPETGKYTWLPFQQERATHDTVTKWCASPRTTGLALVCGDISGGMRCIDFDEPATFEAWGRLIGDRSELNGCLVQKTGKGYQVLHQSLNPGANQVFAFAPDDSEKGMHPIAETRGNGGYCLLGGSLHPNGNRYIWLKNYNDLNALQVIPLEKQDRWDALARSLNQVEKAKNIIERVERTHHDILSKAAIVMKEFSRNHPATEYLDRFGYHATHHGAYVRPGGQKQSVYTYDRDDVVVSWHFNTADSIFGESLYGKPHDGFDWMRITECNGDLHEALRLAAADVGIEWETHQEYAPSYTQPFQVLEGEGNTIILTDSPELVELLQQHDLPVAIGPSRPWPRKYISQLMKYANRYIAFAGDENDAQMVAIEMEAKVMEFQGGLINFIRKNSINEFALQLRYAYSVEM